MEGLELKGFILMSGREACFVFQQKLVREREEVSPGSGGGVLYLVSAPHWEETFDKK